MLRLEVHADYLSKNPMTKGPNPNQIPMTKTKIEKKAAAAVVFIGIWSLVIGI